MKKMMLLSVAMLVTSMGFAAMNPVSVGPGKDYATIEDAISSWCQAGANASATPPFVINVDPGIYEEQLTINDTNTSGAIAGDMILQSAVPGTKFILKLRYGLDPDSPGNRDGLWIFQSRYNVTFMDIVFCPSLLGTPMDDDMIRIDENTATTPALPNSIEFYDCIFTDVDAGGNPVVSSKAEIIDADYPGFWSTYTPSGIFGSGDTLLKWWGDDGENLNGKMVNCGFLVKECHCARINLDGTEGEQFEVTDCVFASASDGEAALQCSPNKPFSSVTIKGAHLPAMGNLDECNAVLSSGGDAVWCSGVTSATVTIENLLVDVNDQYGTTASSPLRGGFCDLSVQNSILSVTGDPDSIVVYPVNVHKPVIFQRVTIYMPGVPSWLDTGDVPYPGAVYFRECVVAGADMGHYNPVPRAPLLGVNMDRSVIATNGPDAVLEGCLGDGVAFNAYDLFCDPMFLSKNRKLEIFMDTSNPVLAFQASDGTSIGGGGDYRGPDAGDNYDNIFKSFGNCEGDIFIDSSDRAGTPDDANMLLDQNPVRGVIGNALMCSQIAVGSRLEGLSSIVVTNFAGSDQIFTMYYKIPSANMSSMYPRLTLKRNQTVTPPQEGTGDGGRCIWTRTSAGFIIDSQWHLFTPNVSTLTWTPGDTASLYVNNFFPYCETFYLDEIVFYNPIWPCTGESCAQSRVEDWGLY